MMAGAASAIPTICCRRGVRLEATMLLGSGPVDLVLTLVFTINDAQSQLTRR